MFFHPIAGRWRPACLRVATASVETVSPPSELYANTARRSRPPVRSERRPGGRRRSRPRWARLGGPPWGHSEWSEESLRLLHSVHGTEPSERLLVARGGRLVGMTPWPRPFDALAIPPARPSARRGGLKAGAGATTTRTAPGRCLELTLFDGVLIIL